MLYHLCKVGEKQWKMHIYLNQKFKMIFQFLVFQMDMEVINDYKRKGSSLIRIQKFCIKLIIKLKLLRKKLCQGINRNFFFNGLNDEITYGF